MSESDSTTLTKVCTKCGREHPATSEYFRARAGSKLHSQCKECMAAYNSAYQASHREELAAYKAAYQAAHRDEIAAYYAEHRDDKVAYSAAYRAAHRDERAAYDVAYRAIHREDKVAYHAAYRAIHREERASSSRAYRIEHPDYHRDYRAEHHEQYAASWSNRRARQKGNGGTHTADDVRAQYARQKGTCYWCHVKVGDTYHVDHVMPLILGGSNGPENLVIACPTCNMSKGAKHPQNFAGRLL